MEAKRKRVMILLHGPSRFVFKENLRRQEDSFAREAHWSRRPGSEFQGRRALCNRSRNSSTRLPAIYNSAALVSVKVIVMLLYLAIRGADLVRK